MSIGKYIAKPLEKIDNGPEIGQSLKVGVFETQDDGIDVQIGEYIRNIPGLGRTFSPFTIRGKDYALYSPTYTTTRIMELPSCRDIGGEEPNPNGFCPVDFYVPIYIDVERIWTNGKIKRSRETGQKAKSFRPDVSKNSRLYAVGELTYYEFGFVAGCIWGDDSSSKLEYLDLTEADKGIIKRSARFGYIELAEGLDLEKAISIFEFSPGTSQANTRGVTISIQQHFNLDTGKILNI